MRVSLFIVLCALLSPAYSSQSNSKSHTQAPKNAQQNLSDIYSGSVFSPKIGFDVLSSQSSGYVNCRYIKIVQNGIEENLVHPADRGKNC